jgi:signal transduction histidine kinase
MEEKNKNLVVCLSCIGHEDSDTNVIKQRKEFLIYMGLIMSFGGLVWGSICLFFDLVYSAAIPLGYTLFTTLNFLYFKYSKNFPVVRSVQMIMSILLPFLFQWSLGGFISSGAVMMWATLSLIASLSFQDTRSSIWWLVLFLALNIFSAIIEPYVNENYNIHLPIGWSATFFVINISVAVAVVFSLVVYFINVRDNANTELDQKHRALKQSQAQLIQSEKLAVLGQLIAGVAHEVNTPLGAIQASIGIITDSTKYLTNEFPQLLEQLTPDEKGSLFELIQKSSTSNNSLSAKEERQFKRQLASILEDNGIDDSESVADTFVDIGIYSNIDSFVPILKQERGEQLLKAVYNLSEQNKNSHNIKTAVERASKVVFALKNYAHRNHTESKISSNVTKGLETVLTLYHNQIKKGITINRHFDPVPDILCYPDELNQVWTNIIHNAIQAMDNNGIIDIETGVNEKNQIFVNITDNGKGIPPEIIGRIFDPFFTTKPAGEGSGLGLDIVKQIINKHGGEITVASVPGKTTFTVLIPVIKN